MAKNCEHKHINSLLECKDCGDKFHLQEIPCQVKSCEKLSPVYLDDENAIVNQQMFYVCIDHIGAIKEGMNEFEKFITENEAEFEKILKESFEEQIRKSKEKMH